MKCDRQQPCVQCVKRRRVELCEFVESSAFAPPPPVRRRSPLELSSDGGVLNATSTAAAVASETVNGDRTALDGGARTNGVGLRGADDVENLQARVMRLERLISAGMSGNGVSNFIIDSGEADYARGLKPARERYYGLSDTGSLISLVCRVFLRLLFFPFQLSFS